MKTILALAVACLLPLLARASEIDPSNPKVIVYVYAGYVYLSETPIVVLDGKIVLKNDMKTAVKPWKKDDGTCPRCDANKPQPFSMQRAEWKSASPIAAILNPFQSLKITP